MAYPFYNFHNHRYNSLFNDFGGFLNCQLIFNDNKDDENDKNTPFYNIQVQHNFFPDCLLKSDWCMPLGPPNPCTKTSIVDAYENMSMATEAYEKALHSYKMVANYQKNTTKDTYNYKQRLITLESSLTHCRSTLSHLRSVDPYYNGSPAIAIVSNQDESHLILRPIGPTLSEYRIDRLIGHNQSGRSATLELIPGTKVISSNQVAQPSSCVAALNITESTPHWAIARSDRLVLYDEEGHAKVDIPFPRCSAISGNPFNANQITLSSSVDQLVTCYDLSLNQSVPVWSRLISDFSPPSSDIPTKARGRLNCYHTTTHPSVLAYTHHSTFGTFDLRCGPAIRGTVLPIFDVASHHAVDRVILNTSPLLLELQQQHVINTRSHVYLVDGRYRNSALAVFAPPLRGGGGIRGVRVASADGISSCLAVGSHIAANNILIYPLYSRSTRQSSSGPPIKCPGVPVYPYAKMATDLNSPPPEILRDPGVRALVRSRASSNLLDFSLLSMRGGEKEALFALRLNAYGDLLYQPILAPGSDDFTHSQTELEANWNTWARETFKVTLNKISKNNPDDSTTSHNCEENNLPITVPNVDASLMAKILKNCENGDQLQFDDGNSFENIPEELLIPIRDLECQDRIGNTLKNIWLNDSDSCN